MANAGFQVFDKLTGTSVFGPVAISSIWAGFGGACENGGRGDPVVIYDQLADRWIISQFATPGGASARKMSASPFHRQATRLAPGIGTIFI